MEKQNQNIATAIKGNNVTLTNCPVTIHAGDAASAMSDGDNKKNETAEPSTSGPPVPKKKRKTAKPRQKKTPEIDEGYVEISEGIFMNNKEPLKEGTQIFRAYQEHGAAGRRPLAVKRISPCTDKNVREVQHLIKLASHPNIVQIIQSKEPQSDVRTLYIIMELCSSQNLQDFLNENRIKNIPFDSKAAMSFSKQLVDGMKFVHSSGIIHNDIKPENVLLLEDKQHIKITDFGLGKQLRVGRSLTKVTSQGSDGYRAPETYKSGTHTISKQADIFSLGITMFFVCSNGKHPFGDDEDLLNYNIKHNKGRDLSGLMIPGTKNVEFLDLINKMLQHDPLHRPTIIEVSQHPFFTTELAFPKESRLQSDSAAIYSGVTLGKVRGSATIKIKAKDIDENAATADTRSLDSTILDPPKEEDEKSTTGTEKNIATPDGTEENVATPEGTEENVVTPEGTVKKNATLGSHTQKTRTKTADVRKNLQGYGVRVQRLTRDFRFGKEWEGKFRDQKVTIMQFNEDDAEKYENAIDVLAGLKHENIVHFIKEIPENCVIIYEFCEYGTLKEYLAWDGKRAELSDLLRMAAQIASGMDFLHRKKYVHCGLRAENVAVTANLLCKISGFGMSRHVGMRGGSSVDKNDIFFKWAAQEVIQKGYISFKSDVWSFGVVLWEIVTRGDEPYSRITITLKESICGGHRLLQPKQCPSGLYFNIMTPCWNEDVDARPTFKCLEKSLLSYDVEADQKEESVTVRALEDHLTVKEGQLSFKEGDIIVDCTAISNTGWLRGTLDGKTGSISTNQFVQIKTHEA